MIQSINQSIWIPEQVQISNPQYFQMVKSQIIGRNVLILVQHLNGIWKLEWNSADFRVSEAILGAIWIPNFSSTGCNFTNWKPDLSGILFPNAHCRSWLEFTKLYYNTACIVFDWKIALVNLSFDYSNFNLQVPTNHWKRKFFAQKFSPDSVTRIEWRDFSPNSIRALSKR